SATISGPIPSPGRIRICLLIRLSISVGWITAAGLIHRNTVAEKRYAVFRPTSLDRAEQPGVVLLVLALEGADRLGILQSQADIVQAVEQAVLAEGIDFEGVLLAVRTGNALRSQIDGQLVTLGGFGLLEQLVDLILFQYDRQQAVLEAVVVEDVGKARRDDGAEAILVQRPRRMFARRATAEVLTRQQHAGALVAREVQPEVLVHRALRTILVGLANIQVAPCIEQVRSEAGALDGLQKLLGDDLVGIDVGAVQRAD